MRRIGFRRALPVVLTAVHLILVWSVLDKHNVSASAGLRAAYRPISLQGGVGIPLRPLGPPPLKPVHKIALLLDLPALMLAIPIAAIVFSRNEMAWLYTSIPFVPVLWYGIGRWLDGLLGYVQRLHLPQPLSRLLAVPAMGLLCLSAIVITPLYHHRTTDTFWVGIGLIFWSGLLLGVIVSSSLQRTSS